MNDTATNMIKLCEDAYHDGFDDGFVTGYLHESDLVEEFHRKAGQPVREVPQCPPDEEVRLRLRLLAEEFRELLEACGANPDAVHNVDIFTTQAINSVLAEEGDEVDMVAVADALTDIHFVNVGSFLSFGLPKEVLFDAVSDSNATKFQDGVAMVGGKVAKGPSFKPPNIRAVLVEAGWNGSK
jgi:predicted HAD superfamily Cof-like phosphohydrolase